MENKIEYLFVNFIDEDIRKFALMYTELYAETGTLEFAMMADIIIEKLSRQ